MGTGISSGGQGVGDRCIDEPVVKLIDQAIVTGESSGNGLTYVSSTAIGEGGEQSEHTFSCDSGGTLVARAYKDDMVGGPFVDQVVAAGACSIDDSAYEGSASKGVRFVRGTDVSTFNVSSQGLWS